MAGRFELRTTLLGHRKRKYTRVTRKAMERKGAVVEGHPPVS